MTSKGDMECLCLVTQAIQAHIHVQKRGTTSAMRALMAAVLQASDEARPRQEHQQFCVAMDPACSETSTTQQRGEDGVSGASHHHPRPDPLPDAMVNSDGKSNADTASGSSALSKLEQIGSLHDGNSTAQQVCSHPAQVSIDTQSDNGRGKHHVAVEPYPACSACSVPTTALLRLTAVCAGNHPEQADWIVAHRCRASTVWRQNPNGRHKAASGCSMP
jgi:hypothetical protein